VIPPRVAQEIRSLFGEFANLAVIRDRGLSQATVFRIETRASIFAIKLWPASIATERLLEIHAFQNHMTRCPEPILPRLVQWSDGHTLLEADGTRWEIAEWKPGAPIEKLGEISDEQLCQCADALAILHLQSAAQSSAMHPPPGLAQRAQGITRALRAERSSAHRFLHSIASHHSQSAAQVLQDLSTRAHRILPAVMDTIERMSRARVLCFWVLRDVWREHLLFQGNRLTGIVDLGAARMDWPGLDLVRAFGTLMSGSDPRWSFAIARYLETRPDTSITFASLEAVHRASVALSALQWIDWFAEGRFDWADSGSRAWARVIELQQQLVDLGTIQPG
jgi:Ser/Thr protein kinase RdoA (MazF antagonist)